MTRSGPPQFEPCYFDMATGGEMPATDGCCAVIYALASTAKAFPEWVVESAGEANVTLGPVESAAGRAMIGLEALGRRGEIALASDPSGWVLVTCHIDGQERFRAYLDHLWEEYEFHPPEAAGRPGATPMRRDASESGATGSTSTCACGRRSSRSPTVSAMWC